MHSGDVKIYENLEVLPRAFVVHSAVLVPDDEAALAALRDPGFDPARQVILAAGQEMAANDPAQSQAEIIAYEPEQVQIRASLDTPGYLVLTDTYYPGWRAEVDGQPVPIRRADLYFRAVALEAGEHEVIFRYEPTSAYAGLVVGLLGWLAWGVVCAVSLGRIGRKNPSGV